MAAAAQLSTAQKVRARSRREGPRLGLFRTAVAGLGSLGREGGSMRNSAAFGSKWHQPTLVEATGAGSIGYRHDREAQRSRNFAITRHKPASSLVIGADGCRLKPRTIAPMK